MPGVAGSGSSGRLVERRRRALGPAYQLFYDEPLELVVGSGTWVRDASGRRYLDMYNNVPHVGHCHPAVVAAIAEQAAKLNTHTRYLHEGIVTYAERLLGTLPESLDVAMFSCSGSEANELALRIARQVTGRQGVVVIGHAYHGNSEATWEISPEEYGPDETPSRVAVVAAPDRYRGAHRGEDAASRYADEIVTAIRQLETVGVGFAAFVIDTIASSSGVVAPPAGYLAAAAAVVRDHGGLFIADEVQPGLGRTGRSFWGFEADGVTPDIVTAGKPLGNGHPLAATFLGRELAEDFARDVGYFNTFGGNPVSAAAGLAVLDVIEDEGLMARAAARGVELTAALTKLAERFAIIGDVRGNGLFLGVDLVTDPESRAPATAEAAAIVNRLRHRGVLTSTIGPAANVLKLRPPLSLSSSDAEFFLEQLEATLAEL